MSQSISGSRGIFVSPQHNAAVMDAARNFFSGFVVNYIFHSANPGIALLGGAVSATASLIDFAIRPLFTLVFGRNFHDTVEEAIIRNVVVLSIVSAASIAAAPVIGTKIVVSIFGTVATRIALSVFDEQFIGQSTVVIN